MPELKVEPSDDKDGRTDPLTDTLALVSDALARRANESPLTAEQCEEISRRST